MRTPSGAVSGGHEKVIDTAAEILEAGGNAADAAISAYLMACVAEPCMASLGAGMLALYWPNGGKPLILDAFCQTPKVKRPEDEIEFFPVLVDFGEEKELFYAGMGAVAIPAVVSGLFELHERLGSIPLTELCQPAIEACKYGVPLSDFQHHDLILLEKIFRKDHILTDIFYKDNKLVDPGTLIKMPEFAEYLDFLSRESSREFYEGEFAKSLLDMSREYGGHITREDLAQVSAEWSPALNMKYLGAHIFSPGFPSFGGWLVKYWFDNLARDTEDDYREKKGNAIWSTSKVARDGLAQFQSMKQNGTSHFNIIDRFGNALSMTFSIGEGSGRVIRGTGVHTNNMLGEAALLPGGFHSWQEDVRMISMMSPVALFHEERKTRIILGTGGAGRIPLMLSQVMQDWISGERSLSEDINSPRCHFDGATWQCEPGYPLHDDLRNKAVNKWSTNNMFFGGAHAILDRGHDMEAVGDKRRDGVGKLIY